MRLFRRRKVSLEDFNIPEVKDGTIDFILVHGETPQIIINKATIPSVIITGTIPPPIVLIDGVLVVEDEDAD